jgi:hypothetical protein
VQACGGWGQCLSKGTWYRHRSCSATLDISVCHKRLMPGLLIGKVYLISSGVISSGVPVGASGAHGPADQRFDIPMISSLAD